MQDTSQCSLIDTKDTSITLSDLKSENYTIEVTVCEDTVKIPVSLIQPTRVITSTTAAPTITERNVTTKAVDPKVEAQTMTINGGLVGGLVAIIFVSTFAIIIYKKVKTRGTKPVLREMKGKDNPSYGGYRGKSYFAFKSNIKNKTNSEIFA